jgi:DNA-binding transcriptional LysR family regulator
MHLQMTGLTDKGHGALHAVRPRDLCYLLAAVEARDVGLAARRLHMADRSLEEALRAMERELDVELFARHDRGLVPTPAAGALADEARRVLARLAAPAGDRPGVDGRARTLRIGAAPYLSTESLRLFLAILHDRDPGVAAQVGHALTAEQLRRLRSGELDLAIISSVGGEADLDTVPVFAGDAMAAYVPAGGHLAARRVLRPDDLREQDLVMFPRSMNPSLYEWWLATIHAAGYRFRRVHAAAGSDPQDLVTSVTAGLGVVLANSAFVETSGIGRLVAARAIDPPLWVPDQVVAWRRDAPPRLRALLPVLRSVAHELRGQSMGRRFIGEAHGREELTARELEVLQLAAHGLSARQVAERLTVSPATVRSHLENIYPKLGVTDKTSAVATALRQGLIR